MSEEDIVQKRKEAAAKIAPNLGQKNEEKPDSDDLMQKRKEAAAKIAPSYGKKREKLSEEAVENTESATTTVQEQKDEMREMRVAAVKEAATSAKSEDKREETADEQADKWQGVTEAAKEAAIPEEAQEYTVQAGDSLWKIADKFYQAGAKWNQIYEANKDVIGDNPSAIRAGQVLKIPKLAE